MKRGDLSAHQAGFAIWQAAVLLLLMMGALASLVSGKGFNMAGVSASNMAGTLASQAQYIRQQVLACAVSYPAGDNGTGFRSNYPAATALTNVSALVCPGSGQNLWSGGDGNFVPKPIAGFGVWQFVNDATSMRLSIAATSSANSAGIAQAAAQIGSEAVVSSGTTLTITLSL